MVSGEYYIALGVTKLDEDYENVGYLDVEKNSAYLHERVHFIQNCSTVYGVTRATYYLSQYLGMILKVKKGEFPLSSFLPYDNEEQDFVNALFTCSAGDTFSNDGECIQCHSIEQVVKENIYAEYYEETFPEWKDKFKEQIILKFDNDCRYELGGNAISESMAYLFEKFFFSSNDYSHRFPYNVCEMLYQYVVGEDCQKITILIALCYASMMTMWPGNTFIELLYEFKEKKDEIQSMQDVFELSSSKMLLINESIITELCRRIDLIFPIEKENPIDIFEEESKYTCEWLKERYRYISGHESKFRDALIWVMEECEEERKISAMTKLLDEYGQPLIIDKNGKLYNANDKKMVHLLAPFALWGLLMERNGKCSLYQVCKGNDKKPDIMCCSECWKHECIENICIFRYYLYKMGLGDIQFENLRNSPFKE